ncbi:single-stranded DNA-binding protein [Microbacterium sp. P5_E9]
MSDTITVTGNIATEPEHKRTPAGVAITTFRLASGQRRYDRESGAWIDSGTNWFTVSTFRGLAEHTFASVHKGDRVILTGRLRLRDWDTGSRKGTTAEIDAEAIGHDLLWGTTHFEKDGPSASAAIQTTNGWPAAGEARRTDSDGWALPGSGELEAPELELAGLAASAAEGEAPF